jgi:hypothetical protein
VKRRIVIQMHGQDFPTDTLLETLKQIGIDREGVEYRL